MDVEASVVVFTSKDGAAAIIADTPPGEIAHLVALAAGKCEEWSEVKCLFDGYCVRPPRPRRIDGPLKHIAILRL